MPEREYIWFAEPLDSDTNEIIAQQLPASDFNSEIVCVDGRKHNLWTCSNQFAMSLVESEKSLDLHFKIWGKQGHHGKIRDKLSSLVKNGRKYKKQKNKKQKLPINLAVFFHSNKVALPKNRLLGDFSQLSLSDTFRTFD